MYLAVIMDLFSRKVIGWAMRETLHTDLVLGALDMAQRHRQLANGVLHHSDRGVQYASGAYSEALMRLAAMQSVSRKGECWDNVVLENFFSTLKLELNLGKAQETRVYTRTFVFEWIEAFYNRQRRHSTLGYFSPYAFEER